jgi:dTDP-4-amino-4,6-dideoxygalactose transaminase
MLDLISQYQPLREEVMAEIRDIFETQYFILGPRVKKLEQAMAALSGVPYGIGVSCGTDALLLAVMALDVHPGDEVITTPYSFFATVSSIVRAGATPVFADVDPDSFNLNPDLVAAAITNKTKALLPVHLFGQMIKPSVWTNLAAKHNCLLIEDAAQAVGAKRDGVVSGGLGDIACFSFYPTKNLGGAGDGGMVLTKHAALEKNIRENRVHGGRDRYYHDRIGICGRLDEIQAAVLNVKFARLDAYNEKRRANAKRYNERLNGVPVQTPVEVSGAYHTYHQYVIKAPRRDDLMQYLRSKEVGCDVYYPVPLHLQKCFEFLGYKSGQLPVSEALAKETLALPMSAELSDNQIDFVASTIADFYGGAGA